MTLEEFILRAVGVPFLWKGRDYDGWDCWGLVWRAYLDVFQVRLPSYSEHYNHQQENERLVRLFQEGKDEWKGTLKPDDGNVAVIFRGGLMIHTGLMIAQGSRILHVQEGCETVHEPMIRFRIEGIYRRSKGKSDLTPAD